MLEPVHRRRALARGAASVGGIILAACGAEPVPQPPAGGQSDESTVAEGVHVDVVANGRRVVVRNQRPEPVLVLDVALEPRREQVSGTFVLTYVRPAESAAEADEPATFEAVPVESGGKATLTVPFVLAPGERLRYCLEVVDVGDSTGGQGTLVLDRDPATAPAVACSSPFEVE